MRFLCRLSALIAFVPVAIWSIPAFPGAEGWGKNSIGGRGGQVIHVTTLANSGPGSFRTACGVVGPKIIVFDTGGVIDLGNTPVTLSSNTTIAGQTAPGGITLIHGGLYTPYGPGASNIIIRFIRVRRAAAAADGDCFRFSNAGSHDIMLDHSSGFWCSDEILDMSYACYNISIQSCILGEPGYCSNAYGSGSGYGNNRTACLSTDNDGRITFYKTVFAHSMKRNPFCSNGGSTSNVNKTFELINNVFYNCMAGSGETFDAGNTIPLNLMGNYYKGGANADYGSVPFAHSGTVATPKKMYVHASGNFHFKYPTLHVAAAFFNSQTVIAFVDSMIMPRITTGSAILDAQTGFEAVMGGSGVLPRDAAEARLINEIRTQTGAWVEECDVTPDPYMTATGSSPTRAAADTDRDGMPDTWETANSLNPNDPADRTTDMGGYNAVEVYLNQLADSIITTVAVEKPEPRNLFGGRTGLDVLASPNPLNAGVRFTLMNAGSEPVSMAVYDTHGKILHTARFGATETGISWNGRDSKGNTLAAGTYLVRFSQNGKSVEKAVSLIR